LLYGNHLHPAVTDPAVTDRSPRVRSRLLLLATAFLFSTGGAAIKMSALSSWQVAGFRSGIAAVVLWLAMPGARRHWTMRTLLVGLAYAATLILFVMANKLTTSANAIFLQSTAPVYLLLLGPLVLHEPVRRIDFAVIAAIAVGAVLLLSGTENHAITAPDPARGNLMALAAGVAWALTLTGLRLLSRHAPDANAAAATVIAGNGLAFLICLPMSLPARQMRTEDVAILLYLGIFQIGLAYLALNQGLRHVPAFEASTLLLAEPVLNPLWTWAIHGERPGTLALLGGAVIILTSFYRTFRTRAEFTGI
jgi:drug/metabolite transporter (DMT)-like permease